MYQSLLRLTNNSASRPLINLIIKHQNNSLLSYGFCQENKISITIPLHNRSPLLYAKQKFSEGKNQKVPPLIVYVCPSLLFGVHEIIMNCWSTWSIVYGSCLFLFGFFIKRNTDSFLGRSVQALQISQDLSKFYVTVANNLYTERVLKSPILKFLNLKNTRELSTPEDYGNLEGIYIPLKKKKKYEELSYAQKKGYMRYLLNLENNYRRIQVPRELIRSISYLLPQKELKQLKIDREELDFQSFYKKYEKKRIEMELDVTQFYMDGKRVGQPLRYIVTPSSCSIKSRYLEALIYGKQIQVKIESVQEKTEEQEKQK